MATTIKTSTSTRDVTAELAFLTRALKAPTLREAVGRLAERARGESWTHEEFLAAFLQREVSARESHDDGALIIVDYKTDAVPAGAVGSRVVYNKPQMDASCRALTAATGSAGSAILVCPHADDSASVEAAPPQAPGTWSPSRPIGRIPPGSEGDLASVAQMQARTVQTRRFAPTSSRPSLSDPLIRLVRRRSHQPRDEWLNYVQAVGIWVIIRPWATIDPNLQGITDDEASGGSSPPESGGR